MSAARAMRIDELLRGIAMPACGDNVVTGLTQDSREVRAGDAFVALAGAHVHGIAFAPMAIAQGAVAVFAEERGSGSGDRGPEGRLHQIFPDPHSPVPDPVIWIENLREQLGEIAARFFGRPSEALTVIGVTGTNGKTSTVQMLAQALTHLGHCAATIGTLGAGLHGALSAGERTTPDAINVHALLAGFRDAGASHVAMEVSSHALDQHRVDAVAFDVAVFTNLTRDHLDYHGTMNAYGAAKAKLLAWPGLRAAVINIDDPFGRELAAKFATIARHPGQGLAGSQYQDRKKLLRYAIENDDAELRAHDVRSHADGVDFQLHTPWGESAVRSKLLGRFNVTNLLAVAGCLGALGFEFDAIRVAIESLQPVAGRMNRLGGGVCPLVVVDYAHTPDALQQALTTLRPHSKGKLICVFGAGGERDAGKRPQMGASAEAHADLCIVTDDNPRGEDGDHIVAAILEGFQNPTRAVVMRDRACAIEFALCQARAGDVVLIAGKGHETYQESAGAKHAFDDLAVARRTLETRAC